MKNLTMGSLNTPNLECFDTDMDNYLHLQVLFDRIKLLTIMESENTLSCDKIDISHFNGLGELAIIDYRGSSSFFPSLITRSLVNLTSLTIKNCDELVQVIEDNEENDKMGSRGEWTSLFPKLQKLQLEDLRKLVSFCEWKCDVELSLLRQVKILRCPNMKRCTLGRLATPNLGSIRINKKEFDATQDLNVLLQQVYEERKPRNGGER